MRENSSTAKKRHVLKKNITLKVPSHIHNHSLSLFDNVSS